VHKALREVTDPLTEGTYLLSDRFEVFQAREIILNGPAIVKPLLFANPSL
jgi:hypothetical protein